MSWRFGDQVAKITKAFGVEPCEECKRRQEKLNELSDWLTTIFGKKDVERDESSRDAGHHT